MILLENLAVKEHAKMEIVEDQDVEAVSVEAAEVSVVALVVLVLEVQEALEAHQEEETEVLVQAVIMRIKSSSQSERKTEIEINFPHISFYSSF